MRRLWVLVAGVVASGCSGSSTSTEGDTGAQPTSASTGGTATLVLSGTDVDTDQPVSRTFTTTLDLASLEYAEDTDAITLFLGTVSTTGDGSTIESVEVSADLTFPRSASGPVPSDQPQSFGLPESSQMLGVFTVTVDGAFDGRVFMEDLEVTASTVEVSDFEVLTTAPQCLEPEAPGPCETSTGMAHVDAMLVGENDAGGRAEMTLDGTVSAWWSQLLN
ncbi:MAG: hypothetical protein KTR31_38535 [Myxococcales bacterium]|nr:hypothetical protein [Myxococcales bacterium]